MVKRKILGLFVGVPDEMLRSIGTIVVLAAQVDLQRMNLLEAATSVAVVTSANYPRDRLTRAIRDAFSAAPLDRLWRKVDAWLREADNLFDIRDELAHSVGGFETRGDGVQRYVMQRPKTGRTRLQFTAERLNEFTMRLLDANSSGLDLYFETGILVNQGPNAHDAYVAQREQVRRAMENLADSDTEDAGDGSQPSGG